LSFTLFFATLALLLFTSLVMKQILPYRARWLDSNETRVLVMRFSPLLVIVEMLVMVASVWKSTVPHATQSLTDKQCNLENRYFLISPLPLPNGQATNMTCMIWGFAGGLQ